MHRVNRICSHMTGASGCNTSTGTASLNSNKCVTITSNTTAATSSTASSSSASSATPNIATADLCDDHASSLSFLPVQWRRYGQRTSMHGQVLTLKSVEDNSLVRSALETPGKDRILVIDGAGSLRSALVGDQIAALIIKNGWAGVVVYGAIRDSKEISTMPLCIYALGTSPLKSTKRLTSDTNGEVVIAGQKITSGDWLYADEDGIVVSKKKLH